ncbi:hypothetical protein B9G55_01460 [Saccharibacillus sp. O16]|nr:hypothetical protein B9G55_01460 [Saccharibacillus sp. O16]
MASGKEYKIAFKLAADLESSFGTTLSRAETDLKKLERQIRDFDGLRISGSVLTNLQTETAKLERDMRQISRIAGPSGYFTDMKNDVRTVLPDLRDVQRVLEAISRVRMPGNMFGGDMERYLRETRQLRDELERIQNSGGPPPGPGGGGGGGGDPSGGGILALGGPALMAGAAVVGAGIGIGKVSEDYQKAMNQIQASTLSTADEMVEMRSVAKDVYSSNIGEGWEQISQVMGQAKQVTGQVGEELGQTTKNAISLQDTFENLDIESSLKTATTLSKQFGIDTNEAFNLFAQGAAQGLDYSGEMLDSANEYAVYFKTLGLSAEDMFNVFKSGKESGAFNLDKVGDAVKEFGIRIKDGSKTTEDAMGALFAPPETSSFIAALQKGGKKSKEYADLIKVMGDADVAGELLKKLQKGGVTGDKAITAITNELSGGKIMLEGIADGSLKGTEAMSQIIEKLMEMDDKSLQAQYGVALFGTQWEDMEASTIAALTNVENTFDQTKDSMGEITKIKYNTIGQAFRGIGRQIQTSFVLPLVDAALPALSAFSNWFATVIPKVKSFFSTFTGSTNFDKIQDIFKEFSLGNFGESVQDSIHSVLTSFGIGSEAASQFSSMFAKTFAAVQNGFNSFRAWIGPIMAQVGTVVWNTITSLASGFGKIISAIAPVVAYVSGKVGPIIAQVFGFIGTSVIPAFISAWGIIGPKIGEVVGLVGPLMTALFNAIKPTIDGIVAAFQFAWPFIQTIVMTAIDIIKGVIGGLLDVLGGVITFVTGVFAGDWSQAWNGIVQIFSGVWDTIKSIAVGAINGVIQIINNGIAKINGLSFDMPELLGGGHVGVNIPTIPTIDSGGGRSSGGSSWGKSTGKQQSQGRMQAFARGGIADQASIFGEAGPEMAIPLNNSPRSHSLLEQTNRMMGHDTGGGQAVTIEYSPQIIIQGNADAAVIKQAQDDGYNEFKQHMDRYFKQQRRVSFG